jgi:ribosomal protein L29
MSKSMKKIREMTDLELGSFHADLLKEKMNLIVQARTGQLTSPARVNQVRRDIARVNTEKTVRAGAGKVETAK